MLKLNAGFSRKVGEANFGSRGASVNVELELESGLIGDPEALMHRVKQLFAIAKRSVDEELNNGPPAPNTRQHRNAQSPRDQSGRNGQQPVRYATASQLRAIRSICRRQGFDADQLANERYAVNNVDELTLREASSIIDELKAAQGSGRNGGER
jgi:hypothetical protein